MTWSGLVNQAYGESMGEPINIYEAKTQLSKLVDRAAAGEEIVIARAGRPIARLVALAPPSGSRRRGFLAGKIWMSDDFDEPDEEIERLFGMRE